MPRSKDFGEALRRVRQAAGKSLGDLARHLRTSVTYLSDVERGEKAPLSVERVKAACDFLGADPVALALLAAQWSEHFSLPCYGLFISLHRDTAAAALALAWDNLDVMDVQRIERIARQTLKRQNRHKEKTP